jgi:hypothetical protein
MATGVCTGCHGRYLQRDVLIERSGLDRIPAVVARRSHYQLPSLCRAIAGLSGFLTLSRYTGRSQFRDDWREVAQLNCTSLLGSLNETDRPPPDLRWMALTDESDLMHSRRLLYHVS